MERGLLRRGGERRGREAKRKRGGRKGKSPVDLLRRSLLNGLGNFGEERGE